MLASKDGDPDVLEALHSIVCLALKGHSAFLKFPPLSRVRSLDDLLSNVPSIESAHNEPPPQANSRRETTSRLSLVARLLITQPSAVRMLPVRNALALLKRLPSSLDDLACAVRLPKETLMTIISTPSTPCEMFTLPTVVRTAGGSLSSVTSELTSSIVSEEHSSSSSARGKEPQASSSANSSPSPSNNQDTLQPVPEVDSCPDFGHPPAVCESDDESAAPLPAAEVFKSLMDLDCVEDKTTEWTVANGGDLSDSSLSRINFKNPIVVKSSELEGLSLPSWKSPIDFLKNLGLRKKLEIIYCDHSTGDVTVSSLLKHYSGEKIIDLSPINMNWEVSSTKLSGETTLPSVIRNTDIILMHHDSCFHTSIRNVQNEFPCVSNYVMMTEKDFVWDFHVDFGGTAAHMSVLSGAKRFYFTEPTANNLMLLSDWQLSLSTTFEREGPTGGCDSFPELLQSSGGTLKSVLVEEGQTIMFPPGWIHAVHTQETTVCTNGNFWPIGWYKLPLFVRRFEKEELSLPMFKEMSLFVGNR